MISKISEGDAHPLGVGLKRYSAVCSTRKARVQPCPNKEALGDLLPGFPTDWFSRPFQELLPQLQAPLSQTMARKAGWQSPLVVRVSNDSLQAHCSVDSPLAEGVVSTTDTPRDGNLLRCPWPSLQNAEQENGAKVFS